MRKKIKVFDSTGKEVVDEKIRKATLAAMRKVKKPRIQEMETYSRQCRKQNIIDAKDKPYIVGIKWNLGMHLTNDICGKLATQDSYGMGRGVYPKEKYPDIPHDNCHCWDSYVFDNEYFKNNPPSEELIQQVKKDAKYPEFQKWAEEWLKRIKE